MPPVFDAMKIHPEDTVAVLTVSGAKKGQSLSLSHTESVAAAEDIPVGHKIALCDLAAGESVMKYGFLIGRATAGIAKGQWVHTHNMATTLTSHLSCHYEKSGDVVTKHDEMVFWGYPRANGSVGIRNEIWILPMVSCVNHTARLIAERFSSSALPPQIDGIIALSQPYGCSQLGDDHQSTVAMLKNIALHPNAAGVVLLALGCENNTMAEFLKELGDYDHSRILPLICQEHEDELAEGTALVEQLMQAALGDRRVSQPFSKLHIGLKCGASDGFSGITANPLVGKVCEAIVSAGAAAVLTEVPEMFGAEVILMSRAANKQVFDGIVGIIEDFKQYYSSHNQPIYENPSPGNKEGGITTLEEKSLGCVQKGGKAEITSVLEYGGKVEKPGLAILSAPGNDPVSITALAGAGCQLLLFTTGRGNPLATFVPTVKIASNAALAAKKHRWIDYDASRILDDGSLEPAARELFALVLQVVNGTKKTASETAGYHEIGIFKNGVTL